MIYNIAIRNSSRNGGNPPGILQEYMGSVKFRNNYPAPPTHHSWPGAPKWSPPDSTSLGILYSCQADDLVNIPLSTLWCPKVIWLCLLPVREESIIIGMMWTQQAHMELRTYLPLAVLYSPPPVLLDSNQTAWSLSESQ